MKTMVYGTGAVGLGIAATLIKSGVEIDLVSRGLTAHKLRNEGFSVKGIFGRHDFTPTDYNVLLPDEISDQDMYDAVFFCTKCNELREAIGALKRRIGPQIRSTSIILCQNGWGSSEEAIEEIGTCGNIYSARIITGFERAKANEVAITVHADDLLIGSLCGAEEQKIDDLLRTLKNGFLPFRYALNIERHILAKLLFNSSLNPLGAILDVPYGRLAEIESTRHIMNRVISEAFIAFGNAGLCTLWHTPDEYEAVLLNKQIPLTADHRSSMLQDLKAGHLTEINYMNGAIQRLGGPKLTPYNSLLVDLIKAKEQYAISD